MLDALIIAAHPDDAELGMGGTILRMLEDGLRVGILDLTNGEPTPLGTPEIRMKHRRQLTYWVSHGEKTSGFLIGNFNLT